MIFQITQTQNIEMNITIEQTHPEPAENETNPEAAENAANSESDEAVRMK